MFMVVDNNILEYLFLKQRNFKNWLVRVSIFIVVSHESVSIFLE